MLGIMLAKGIAAPLGPFIGLLFLLFTSLLWGTGFGAGTDVLGIILENRPNTDDMSGPLDVVGLDGCSFGEVLMTFPAWWKMAEVTNVNNTVISGPTAVLPDH